VQRCACILFIHCILLTNLVFSNHHHHPSTRAYAYTRFQGWWLFAITHHHHPRTRAHRFVVEGCKDSRCKGAPAYFLFTVFCLHTLFSATTTTTLQHEQPSPTITTLKCKHVGSLSRMVAVCHHHLATTTTTTLAPSNTSIAYTHFQGWCQHEGRQHPPHLPTSTQTWRSTVDNDTSTTSHHP
jgi:hypothetical protein